MKRHSIIPAVLSFPLILAFSTAYSQELSLNIDRGLSVGQFIDQKNKVIEILDNVPFFSLMMDGDILYSDEGTGELYAGIFKLAFGDSLECEITVQEGFSPGWKALVRIYNNTGDTIDIENLVPFGESKDRIYLTSTGPWALARAKLFLPGQGPVGVILPDNAWELGYSALPVESDLSVCALARRTAVEKGEYRRYKTILYPGGSVEYSIYADEYLGEWQNGLKLMFHDRYLYDLEQFDNTLFEREDLEWIRNKYIVGLQFAWNSDFYDWQQQQYHYFSFLEEGMYYFGGYDVFGLWPTWPRLGVDQRNQWDLFSDMPGGLEQLRYFSQEGKKMGTRFFICYNPWDESTRKENPYTGMARLIGALDADGVVLDCHGWSSREYQRAADSVKPGVVMYSEGMAVVKDMPGIVAGRVHDAIYLPPPLNLNKLIKPEFAIFRVCQIHDGRIHREAAIALFNGYGTELNTFAPGQFGNMAEDLLYLGRTSMILRENTSNFLGPDWTPLIPSLQDSIWVNRWPNGDKTVFTVLSLRPGGFQGPLFAEPVPDGHHLVSLWHHDEILPDTMEGLTFIPVKVESFNSYELNTRAEGNVDCIALFRDLLDARLEDGILKLNAGDGDEIRIWAGMPSYQNMSFHRLRPGNHSYNLMELFGRYEGKVVVQLLEENEIIDERILYQEPGQPRLLAGRDGSPAYAEAPKGMVRVPAGTFYFSAENTDQFIPYPDPKNKKIEMPSYYMDIYPVTNRRFSIFLEECGYIPQDTVNFLKHWIDGKIPEGMEDHPVVYVSHEDAEAYARWSGKRLPTEAEWQYAGQGADGRAWPWGNAFDSTLCNHAQGHTASVSAFPQGSSPFGLQDMVGNVWQLTSDVYDNGTCYYVIMKGGSYYKPTSSWWYVKGGPQPLNWHQQLLLVSPGFDRNATVGFRCAADASK